MRRLAAEKIDQDFAEAFLTTPLALKSKPRADGTLPDVRQSRGYVRMMALFNGDARRNEMVRGTARGLVNAVTEWVDHERGRTTETCLDAAWFGAGNDLKTTAFSRMLGAVSSRPTAVRRAALPLPCLRYSPTTASSALN